MWTVLSMHVEKAATTHAAEPLVQVGAEQVGPEGGHRKPLDGTEGVRAVDHLITSLALIRFD
jgi:hypothetical protein